MDDLFRGGACGVDFSMLIDMKRRLPVLLTTLRLLLGPVSLVAALADWPRLLFAPLLVIAVLSDIFDGVLARRFGVSTPALRRYDSATDVVFYLFVLVSTWILCRSAIYPYRFYILTLFLSELSCIAISCARFGMLPATHSYFAKFYGLCLFACFLDLLAFDAPGWTVLVLCIVGLTANLEVILIICLSKKAPVDVATIFALSRHT